MRLLLSKRLIISGLLILVLLSSWSCTSESDNDSDVLIFSNPPESQQFKGTYAPSVAAQSVIELEHYMLGMGEDPTLHIKYMNISHERIKLDIGIMWFISEANTTKESGQHDIRDPVLAGQTETLVYRPLVESPKDIVNYYIEVHSLWSERLPHVSLGPQVGPDSVVRTPADEVPPVNVSLEKANLDSREIDELQQVMSEVLTYAESTATTKERQLLTQAVTLLDSITGNSEVHDIIREKTGEERLVLDALAITFAEALKYWGGVFAGVNISSPIGGGLARSAEELGNCIAEWWWMGELGLVRVIDPARGVADITYEERPGEIWVTFELYDPAGHIYAYIPVEPLLISVEGGGSVVLSKGVRPIMDKCWIAYKFND